MSEALNVVPVIPLRDVVIFPTMTIPLNVGRKKSIQAVKSHQIIMIILYC